MRRVNIAFSGEAVSTNGAEGRYRARPIVNLPSRLGMRVNRIYSTYCNTAHMSTLLIVCRLAQTDLHPLHCGETAAEEEDSMSNMEAIIPTALDVIMGRGKRIEYHSGNVNFRRLIETQRPAYLLAGPDNEKKRMIVEWVMNQVIDAGGRFVKAGVCGTYSVVTVLQALEKPRKPCEKSKQRSLQ
jgi:hypothetical protein